MIVNGQPLHHQPATVAALLTQLKLEQERVVVEVDGVIIAKEQFADTVLTEKSRVEVIGFVGGG